MNRKINLHSLYVHLTSVFLVFLYFCHGDNYLILWKGIPSLVFFPIGCLLVLPTLLQKGIVNKIFKNQLIAYFILLVIISVFWAIISLVPFFNFVTNSQYLKVQILNFLIMLICIIFFSNEENVKVLLKLMIYGILLGVFLNVYDILNVDSYYLSTDDPHKRSAFSMIYARAAGLYLDPNVTASTLVFGLILTEHTITNKKLKMLFTLIVGGAVFLTLSLSGVLFYFVYFFFRFIYGKVKLKTILIVTIVFVSISLLVRDLIKRGAINLGPGITARIMTVTNPFDTSEDIVDKNSRTILLRNAIGMIIEDPVFGKGVGQHQFVKTEQSEKTRSGTHAGPHNQWLAFMIDYGVVLGFLMFLLLFFVLYPVKNSFFKKEVLYFLLIYFLYSLFSHTTIKNHSLMFLIPLVYQMGRIKKSE